MRLLRECSRGRRRRLVRAQAKGVLAITAAVVVTAIMFAIDPHATIAALSAPFQGVCLVTAREQPLTIEIVDGRLVVSIGVDALMTAVRGGDDWDDETMAVVDADVFAAEIAHSLEHNEQEDGTTDIHLAIDRAALDAIEGGSEAVRLVGDGKMHDQEAPQ